MVESPLPRLGGFRSVATQSPQRSRGALARADQRRDVRGHAREGVAAAFPGLVLVVAGDEVGADVADGELGDVLGDAEPAHQGARGAAQIVQAEGDAAGPLQLSGELGPALEPATGL